MAYEQLEQLNDRKSEKMALFLTAENMGGLMLVSLPVYLISGGWPTLLRLLAVIGAAVLGVGLTLRVGGLPLYSRILWHVRGAVWLASGRRRVVPDNLHGTQRRTTHTMPLPLHAPARIVRRRSAQALHVIVERPARPAALPHVRRNGAKDVYPDAEVAA